MIWIYRLQQRLVITRHESIVLLVLMLIFTVGLISHVVRTEARPVAADAYVEADRRFAEASRQTVPPVEQTESMALPTIDSRPIDLNAASAEELQRLPRVGPKTAARILDYRARRGRFHSVDELTRVRGIGPKTLARLESLVVVE